MADKKNEDHNALLDVFKKELKDIYWAEKKLTEQLPEMAEKARQADLKVIIEKHLEQTREHVNRLEEVFERLDEKAEGTKPPGMEGILEEGEKMVSEFEDTTARDAVIIAAAQKVEHYEITAYGTIKCHAQQLGKEDIADLLQKTLDEEQFADEMLSDLAERFVNEKAEHELEEQQPPK